MKSIYFILMFNLLSSLGCAKDYRIASQNDFDPLLKEGYLGLERFNSLIKDDFDKDGKEDIVALEIETNTKSYRVVVYLSSKGKHMPNVLWSRVIPKKNYNGIWEALWLKKKGEKGQSKFKYFNAPGKKYPYLSEYTEEDVLVYKKAVKKYIDLVVLEATNSRVPPLDAEGAFYCKQFYYYENGSFHKITKCD